MDLPILSSVRQYTRDPVNRIDETCDVGIAPFQNACVHELFEQQVARTPNAVALVMADQQVSYRQLNERANQVAHFLRRRGIGPEVLVGVCLARSPDMVVGLLGVWKAGAAYVPLDPRYPQERLAFMARDAELPLLLTEQRSRHLFAACAAETICLDTDWPTIAVESADNPAAGATPDNLAYVMYTSGSSGQPKGAMIVHSGLANYLCWAIAAYGFEAGGASPLHSSISFDLTVTSLYPPLLVGGQVELVAEDVGAQNLLLALQRGKTYNVIKITPAHLALLSERLRPEQMANLTRVFVIGGENLLAESLRPWREHAPGTRLINEYGPTETVVGCCVHEVRETDVDSGAIPIGRPIANTRLYVLDADLQPLPPGTSGELYVGGAGVARGYVKRPQLTQERFLADPFADAAGARLYKTGDLVRYRADGGLEFLGRMDSQVKVRGYRIELGEIESHLAAHEDVHACVVLAPEESPGERQLVAHVVPRGNRPLHAKILQHFLKERLPEFMVPGRFVFLTSFPLTQNGKIDREALLNQPADTRATGPSLALPQTPVEEQIAAIWCEILRLERIGIDEDFFELGGHSLMATRAVSRIRDTFAVDFSLRNLFERPTVSGVAAVINGLQWLSRTQEQKHSDGEREEVLV